MGQAHARKEHKRSLHHTLQHLASHLVRLAGERLFQTAKSKDSQSDRPEATPTETNQRTVAPLFTHEICGDSAGHQYDPGTSRQKDLEEAHSLSSADEDRASSSLPGDSSSSRTVRGP